MAHVITVMNMKGGVGKTTVAMHIGGIISRREIDSVKYKVLLIDYDPQFNLSQAFLPAADYYKLESARKTSLSILQDDRSKLNPFQLQVPGNSTPPPIADVVHKIYPRLDIIPSTLDLMYIALGQSTNRTKPFEERFTKFISNCRNAYDLIFIDCHPAGSILTKTSLQNSDHVLIPVTPIGYAGRGIELMLRFIQNVGTNKPESHILFNLTDRSGGASNEELQIRGEPKFSAKCLKNTMHRYKAFSDPLEGIGFTWHSTKAHSTNAYHNIRRIAEELVGRL